MHLQGWKDCSMVDVGCFIGTKKNEMTFLNIKLNSSNKAILKKYKHFTNPYKQHNYNIFI